VYHTYSFPNRPSPMGRNGHDTEKHGPRTARHGDLRACAWPDTTPCPCLGRIVGPWAGTRHGTEMGQARLWHDLFFSRWILQPFLIWPYVPSSPLPPYIRQPASPIFPNPKPNSCPRSPTPAPPRATGLCDCDCESLSVSVSSSPLLSSRHCQRQPWRLGTCRGKGDCGSPPSPTPTPTLHFSLQQPQPQRQRRRQSSEEASLLIHSCSELKLMLHLHRCRRRLQMRGKP